MHKTLPILTVSYTHLDVYKRQVLILVHNPFSSLNPSMQESHLLAESTDRQFAGSSTLGELESFNTADAEG